MQSKFKLSPYDRFQTSFLTQIRQIKVNKRFAQCSVETADDDMSYARICMLTHFFFCFDAFFRFDGRREG